MEKDDFKYQLSFAEDVFGGPRWRDLVGAEQADKFVATDTIPIMIGADGRAVKRNFVHIQDLINAILHAVDNPKASRQTFNICMDEPVDYGELGKYLGTTRGFPTVEIKTPYCSTWLDNTKAKFLLDWRPEYDLKKMVEAAWNYQRAADDPRTIWYPG
jgi:nucleoside-diphosphate-sugar epimerase